MNGSYQYFEDIFHRAQSISNLIDEIVELLKLNNKAID